MNTEKLQSLQDVIHFMKLQCGIDLELSKTQALLAIDERMQTKHCATYADYLLQLQSDKGEVQTLIEHIVVPETWFFRYPESFDCLNECLPKKNAALDILSLPCSTGEEPYSIAIQLLMAGFPKQGFHIDAADISLQSLQHAEASVYYEHSFRHHDLSFRNKYFDALFDARIQRPYWKLHPHVQQCVSFHLANILQPCPTLKPTYDIIFCRNLLIYFDEETKIKVLQRLSAMLKPNGFLFLGHAGGGRQASLTQNFTSFNRRAFVWQKNPSNIIPSTQFQSPLPTHANKPCPRRCIQFFM